MKQGPYNGSRVNIYSNDYGLHNTQSKSLLDIFNKNHQVNVKKKSKMKPFGILTN